MSGDVDNLVEWVMEEFKKHLQSLDTEDFGYFVNLSCMFLEDRWGDNLSMKNMDEISSKYGIAHQQICNCVLLELACLWGDSVDG